MDSDETQDHMQAQAPAKQQTNPLIIPATLLLGFGLIAAAIYFSGGVSGSAAPLGVVNDTTPTEVVEKGSIRPVDENDHIRGNPNAPIVIVEYSDFDCPFCKKFHETMNQIMNDYGASAKVAWVYRHFPIEQLHPNAPGLALASECVASLGDNNAFWTFADQVFGERGDRELTNMTKLSDYAGVAGVSAADFESCISEGRYIDNVNEDFADGSQAGVQGTPYSLILVNGLQLEINGAQPYNQVKQNIEVILSELEG